MQKQIADSQSDIQNYSSFALVEITKKIIFNLV